MSKVLESITWEGRIVGGPYDQHMASFCAQREGTKYTPSMRVCEPSGGYLPIPAEIPSQSLRIVRNTPRAALDEAFKAFYFYLNNENAAVRLTELQERDKWYTLLDESGKRDWPAFDKMSDSERADFQNEDFFYAPPMSEALLESGKMEIGTATLVKYRPGDITADNKLKQATGTEEGNPPEDGGKPSSVDGKKAAETGLSNFLKQPSGLKPELSATQGKGTEE